MAGDEKSRRRSLRITYPRARGLFKCKHNVVPGRIVPLSVILQFNLRSRGSADAARRYRGGDGSARSLARSFVHCNIVKSPFFHHDYLLSLFEHYLSLSLSPSTFGILPRAFFFRLDFFISRWRTRYQVFSLPLFLPFSVIVRVFRTLRIIYERLPLPALLSRRCTTEM